MLSADAIRIRHFLNWGLLELENAIKVHLEKERDQLMDCLLNNMIIMLSLNFLSGQYHDAVWFHFPK